MGPCQRQRQRQRQRHSLPPLKRSSTASLPPEHVRDLDTHDIDDDSDTITQKRSIASHSYFGFFQFDSLNYESTARRNARMLASLQKNDIQQNKHNSCTDEAVEQISRFGSNVAFANRYHYAPRELEPHRSVGDGEMNALLEYLSSSAEENGGCGAFDDVIGCCSVAFRLYREELHSEEAQNNHQTQNNLQTQNNQHTQDNQQSTDVPPPTAFYIHYQTPPPWTDFSQLQRGIDIFLAYLPAVGCALYYRSLIGGFSIPKIVEVLVATRYLVPYSMMQDATKNSADTSTCLEVSQIPCSDNDRKRTLERLLDTGGFLASCFAPPSTPNAPPAASLRPGGKGWEAALRVRVLHAKIRRSLMQTTLNTTSKNKWNVEKNGVPINQEDMAATLLAFSVNVLLGIEFVAGRALEEGDQEDYLALWRYLGWLLGVDTPEASTSGSSNPGEECCCSLSPIDPCGARKHFRDAATQQPAVVVEDPILHSYATLESMILHLLHPEETSRRLVSHLLSFNGRTAFRSEMCRRFLGDPLSDTLGIRRCSGFGIRWTVYFSLLFLRCYTLLAMRFPFLKRAMIGWHGALQKRFLKVWEVNHAKRLGVAMGGGRDGGLKCGRSTACPFSMLMDPSLDSVQT